MNDQERERDSWEDDDDLGDRIVEPAFDPEHVLLVLTIIGVIAVALIMALCGCSGWECGPRVAVSGWMGGESAHRADPQTGTQQETLSVQAGIHCEQKGGQ